MTIALTALAQHSRSTEGLPTHRPRSHPPLEIEEHVKGPQAHEQVAADADRITDSAAGAIFFGPFSLLPPQRILKDADKPVRLGSRALDILIALVERRGELVTKRELMSVVWPDTLVVEANLTVHVAALRRALGDGRAGNRYIVNIPGRGYRFVAPVTLAHELRSPAPGCRPGTRPHNLPGRLTPLIGRAEVVGTLARQMPAQRLITIVGPGGIGKTAVALEVAEELIPAFEHGTWLIDLAPIADPRLVPTALASVLSLEIRSDNPLPGLIAALRDKQMLFVFDNCEHVVEAAAALAAGILRGSRRAQILATSREPLRVEGERVHRLSALESPPASDRLTASEALRFPAVQLFVQRGAAAMTEFELSDAEALSAGDICRKLDGIPLAIELAAARVDTFGVRGVAARLDDRLLLLTGGRRNALPRHRTISTALDWSYQLLSQEEQTIFRRLAIFVGGFSLESARAVVAGADGNVPDVADGVASLVMKSLVTADLGGGEARFRLLETTRAYALTQLAESGEAESLARRHAACYRDLLETAGLDQPATAHRAADYTTEIDNIRAALTWAFSPEGDTSIGVPLAAASAPLWLDMSLLMECRAWSEKAVAKLGAVGRGSRHEMVLQAALASSLMFTRGMTGEAHATWTRAIALADSLKDNDYQLRALLVLWGFHVRLADYRCALAFGERCEAVARGAMNPDAKAMADWMIGVSLHHLGDSSAARARLHQALESNESSLRRAQMILFGIDWRVHALGVLASISWLQGFPGQAVEHARNSVAEARTLDHALPLCMALAWSGHVSSLVGDEASAERIIPELMDVAGSRSIDSYCAFALGLKGQLAARRGDAPAAAQLLSLGLDGLRRARYEVFYPVFQGQKAERLAAAGSIDGALAAIDEALNRIERNEELWWMPEALRIKGEILMLSDTTAAQDHFCRSLDSARRQQALSWELRIAMSLGRLHHAQGLIQEARDLLTSVYSRFTEGFKTADLQRARRLLEEWS